jgi:outer membrane protein TolC
MLKRRCFNAVIFAACVGGHCAADTLTLQLAQERLLQTSPDILAQRQASEKAKADLSVARSALWPSLDASGSYQVFSQANQISLALPPPINTTINKTLGDRDQEVYGLDLTYPLFTGGAKWREIQAQRTAVEAQSSQMQFLQNQVSLSLAALFYAWQIAEAARQAQDTVVSLHRDYAHHIEAVVKGGAGLRSEAAGAKAKLLGAEVDLQAALDLRDSLGRQAALLLGLPAGEMIFFAPEVDAPIDSSSASAGSIGLRPDLEALDRMAEGLEFQEKALTSTRWPAISAMVGYRIANPGLNLGSTDYMNYGLAGIQARWNLFDGFHAQAQRAQARAQREALQVERKKQSDFWDEAVVSAQRLQARLEKFQEAAQAAGDAAQLTLAETQAQRAHGTASDLTLLDAQVQEVKAALQIRQIGLQRRLAGWRLRYARGENLRFQGD